MVHLGDIGNADGSMCTLNIYTRDPAALLKQSPIPVFVLVPSDNNWNNCQGPNTVLSYWMDELNRFEDNLDMEENTNFPSVRRPHLSQTENFSFLQKGVLFIAFHLVDGTVVQSESEWSLWITEDVAWMDEELNAHGIKEYRAIVTMMSHAAPTPSKIGGFVWPIMKDSLIKRNSTSQYSTYTQTMGKMACSSTNLSPMMYQRSSPPSSQRKDTRHLPKESRSNQPYRNPSNSNLPEES